MLNNDQTQIKGRQDEKGQGASGAKGLIFNAQGNLMDQVDQYSQEHYAQNTPPYFPHASFPHGLAHGHHPN